MTSSRVELRSDTFTRPSEGMRRAMYEAEVGDDVWDEDPTVHRLQAQSAELMGKEAGLFVSSGTQGNLIGLLSHCSPGDEVILGDQSHIVWYEVGGAAVVGGLQFRTLRNGTHGRFSAADVAAAIRYPPDVHFPVTGALALENTHNRCGGAVIRPEETSALASVAHSRGVPVHLDGARVFNAAQSLDLPVARLADDMNSVTFCLSKGLGAPVGSVLCGSTSYIERAHRWRKLLGGGMRQVGVLAAAGIYALENNVERLADDRSNAAALADGLANIEGIELDPMSVESNIVAFDVPYDLERDVFLETLASNGILLGSVAGTEHTVRAVTSYEVDRAGIERALLQISRVVRAPINALA
jgi:threonine aldolase